MKNNPYDKNAVNKAAPAPAAAEPAEKPETPAGHARVTAENLKRLDMTEAAVRTYRKNPFGAAVRVDAVLMPVVGIAAAFLGLVVSVIAGLGETAAMTVAFVFLAVGVGAFYVKLRADRRKRRLFDGVTADLVFWENQRLLARQPEADDDPGAPKLAATPQNFASAEYLKAYEKLSADMRRLDLTEAQIRTCENPFKLKKTGNVLRVVFVPLLGVICAFFVSAMLNVSSGAMGGACAAAALLLVALTLFTLFRDIENEFVFERVKTELAFWDRQRVRKNTLVIPSEAPSTFEALVSGTFGGDEEEAISTLTEWAGVGDYSLTGSPENLQALAETMTPAQRQAYQKAALRAILSDREKLDAILHGKSETASLGYSREEILEAEENPFLQKTLYSLGLFGIGIVLLGAALLARDWLVRKLLTGAAAAVITGCLGGGLALTLLYGSRWLKFNRLKKQYEHK